MTLCVTVCSVVMLWAVRAPAATVDTSPPHTLKINDLPEAATNVELSLGPDGRTEYLITWRDSSITTMTPQAYAQRLYDDAGGRPWWKRLLNISSTLSLVWVAIGLGGQVLFTGRMVVQWLVSERAKRSTVPTAFWWMSLVGASMLIVYFIWRRDAIGVLGQATGWFIYVRNIWLIYSHQKQVPTVADDPAPEAELTP